MTTNSGFEQRVESKLTNIDTRIGNVATTAGEIKTAVNIWGNNTQKIIYALIGIVAATLGLKFVGSPFLTIVFAYAAFFSGTFVLVSVIWEWKKIKLLNRLIRLTFTAFIWFSVACRTLVFEASRGVPEWYTPIIDCFYIIICILLTIMVAKQKE